ncbi:MAG: SpoIIE family protein phosphatase [Phycisphaera sp.]|nr:SpoIIE family protein phosphatase [Phycisphaera sp.]
MVTMPVPVDETERLAELRAMHILDTPPERRFDVITDLAKRTLGIEAAFISLVDKDRQFYKSAAGVDADARQSPRDGKSFCAHCICCDGLIVKDALADDRFRDHPAVVNDGVRFYAGLPLRGPGGHKVGTFCVVDTRPNALDEDGLESLRVLAEMAEQQLNMVDVITAQRELLDTKNALVAAQQRESQEVAEAAEFVRSMLPAKLVGDEPVHTDYLFINSSSLGGDLFGYHTLPDGTGRLAVYLLDVTGHGVSAALLSVGVFQTIRRQTLRETDFGDPASVLTALNCAYPMEEHGGKFFTMWYGVYDPATRELTYASAGHAPPIVVSDDGSARALNQGGMIVGVIPDPGYRNLITTLAYRDRLYLFSDGAFEVKENGDGTLLMPEGLMRIITDTPVNAASRVGYITEAIRAYQGADDFKDDYSLLELRV